MRRGRRTTAGTTRSVKAYGPLHAGPGRRGAALRAGDLRGPQGLPARRRLDLGVPARRPTPPGSSARRAGWPCRELPAEDFLGVDRGARRRPTRTGCPSRRRGQPLPAAVHVRVRGVPRACGRAEHVPYCVIASPGRRRTSPAGVKPVSIWLSEEYTRAAPGGTGAAKCGGNYAASLAAQQRGHRATAATRSCFLDAVEHRWVEELGGMNMFFVYGRRHARSTPRADRHDPRGRHPGLAS